MKKSKTIPTLRLTPYAWAKLLRLRDLGETEVGGFGISASKDLLLIEDFCLIQQRCTEVTVKFDDEAVADYFDLQVDRGLAPEQFGRIWIHTHPGDSPLPSFTDEETFARCFGSSDWALMFIVACGGQTYARLRFNTGPGGETLLPVEVDYSQSFAGSAHELWDEEYRQCVEQERKSFIRSRSERDDFTDSVMRRALLREEQAEFLEEYESSMSDPSFYDDPYFRPFMEVFDDRIGFPF